ncbi:hypothetical protein KSC_050290 [Ktedonobacter sp. SOSP1-52]|nr:hypothetical protein KSC_050290 [Ktedonobacter sp. SOSP1-52]
MFYILPPTPMTGKPPLLSTVHTCYGTTILAHFSFEEKSASLNRRATLQFFKYQILNVPHHTIPSSSGYSTLTTYFRMYEA